MFSEEVIENHLRVFASLWQSLGLVALNFIDDILKN